MRITVKVGTSTLTHATGRLNIQRIEKLCKVLSDLKNAGHEIILVSSGAIGMGVGKLNLPGRPADMPGKQAAAAVGQCERIYTYDKLSQLYGGAEGQALLDAVTAEHTLIGKLTASGMTYEQIGELADDSSADADNSSDESYSEKYAKQMSFSETDHSYSE